MAFLSIFDGQFVIVFNSCSIIRLALSYKNLTITFSVYKWNSDINDKYNKYDYFNFADSNFTLNLPTLSLRFEKKINFYLEFTQICVYKFLVISMIVIKVANKLIFLNSWTSFATNINIFFSSLVGAKNKVEPQHNQL